MTITFPFWFKLFLGLSAITIISGIIKYLSLNKHVIIYRELPDEKRNRIIKSYRTVVTLYKIFLWAAPLQLIVIPYIFYIYIPEKLFHIIVMMPLIYLFVIEDFFFRRYMLRKIQE
jgi:hypothetical protein